MFQWYDVHTMSKLGVHITSKVATHKISLILNSFKIHI
jgi:hypothetical protein